MRDGMRIRERKFTRWSLAPWKGACGDWRYCVKRSMEARALSDYVG